MYKKEVVGSMSEWSGVLKDLFRQIDDGSVSLEQVQDFLEHKNPFDKTDLIADWESFYRKVFGIKVDFSGLKIPKKKKGFSRLIIVAKGMTSQKVYNKCKEIFPCWKYADNLDRAVQSERVSDMRPYAVWFRDRIEADKELKNLSANDLKERKITSITLEERLVYELKYFEETGRHLDIDNITLCAGSRYSDGNVPRVDWYYSEFDVYWDHPGSRDGSLRSRQAVL